MNEAQIRALTDRLDRIIALLEAAEMQRGPTITPLPYSLPPLLPPTEAQLEGSFHIDRNKPRPGRPRKAK